MSDANLTTLLADEKAYWVDSSHAGLLDDAVIVREWRNLPLNGRIEAVAALKARRKETNPKAQTKAYSGVWRIQKIEDIVVRDKQGGTESLTIRETMAFGLATTLVGETPDLVEEVEIPSTAKNQPISPSHIGGTSPVEQNYKTLTLRWDSLDPTKLNSIMAERTALSESSITVGGESHTGPWYLLSRKPSWDEDGSGIYEEKWGLQEWKFEAAGKQGDMSVTSIRHIQGVPKDRVKAALDAEITLMGAEYGKAGVSYDQKIYWREDSADLITEATQEQAKSDENVSLTQKDRTITRLIYKNASSVPDANAAAQGVTIKVEGRITSSGAFDYEKETITAVKQEITAFKSELTADVITSTKKGTNLYDADLSAYVQADTPTVGKIIRREHSDNNDGTFNDVVVEEERQDIGIAMPATNLLAGNVVKTPRYSSRVEIVDGKTAVPDPLLAAEYGRVSYRKDKYGRYVGEREITEYYDTITIPGWELSETHYHVVHKLRTNYQGLGYIRDIGYIVNIKQTNTASACITFCNTGLVDTPAGSTRYEALSNGQYRAIRIDADPDATTAWTADPDGNLPPT